MATQKAKNVGMTSEKPACDRFRVLLFSERQAESVEELEATNRSVHEWNPESDSTCLHAAKVWSPCTEIVVERSEGMLVPIAVPDPVVVRPQVASDGRQLMQGKNQYQREVAVAVTEKQYKAAIAFLKATRPSVSGKKGHDRVFRAACTIVKEFMIEDEKQAVDLIWKRFNPRCDPPWSMSEISHKVREARKTDKHIYGYGVNKTWDVRWWCCPMLASLLDQLERGEAIEWKLYAPGIRTHAKAALEARRIASRTSKKRVDHTWYSSLEPYLEECEKAGFVEVAAEDLLKVCLGIRSPTQGDRTRLGRAMSALGWKARRRRAGTVFVIGRAGPVQS